MEQHPFEEAGEGGGRALSRRDLLAATGGVVLAGRPRRQCRHGLRGRRRRQAQARRHVPPRRHGRRREGLHRRPVDHHEARPGAPHLRVGDAAQLRPQLQAGHGRAGRGGHAGQRQAVDDPAQERHRVQQRQDAERRRRHLLAAPHRRPEEQAVRRGGRGVDRSRAPQEDGQAHGAHAAQDGGLDDRRAARPVLQRHRPRRLLAHQQAEVGRHGPVHHHELLARPPERAQAQPELLAHGSAVLRQRQGDRLRRSLGAGQRALLGRDRRDDGHPVRAARDRQEPRQHQDPRVARRRLAAALHGSRHAAVRQRQRAQGDAAARRPPGDARPGALRARARRPTTSTRRSTPTTTRRCRSATRTSTRPSRCSRRPAWRT